MRYAVLADIHGNLEALEACAADVRSRSVDEILVIGDAVGYGANPNECLNWVFDHASVFLMGNHERAVFDYTLRDSFNDWARDSAAWTEGVLDPQYLERIRKLPYTVEGQSFHLTHGSLHEPEAFHYVVEPQDARRSFALMKHPLCFLGHTHIPACFSEQAGKVTMLAPGAFSLVAEDRYIVNPGSVGQPRDGDLRLAYGIFDDAQFTFQLIRLEYDRQKAAMKIRNAGLPVFLADRLL